jgi:hypothetical protein
MAGQKRARPSKAAGRDFDAGIEKTPNVQKQAMNSATLEGTKETHGNFALPRQETVCGAEHSLAASRSLVAHYKSRNQRFAVSSNKQ